MPEKIKVMIADDMPSTRESIKKLIEFHPELTFVGEAGSGTEAITVAREIQPDVILMDINMPIMDGIQATAQITLQQPQSVIVMMSVQGEQEYLRKAMKAGAKDYLVKPFTGDDLLQTVKQVFESEQQRRSVFAVSSSAPNKEGKIITVFSTKGGIGKTTIASNLAVTLSEKLGAKVGIIDADLQFGDVALFLDLMPEATLADLVKDIDNLDAALLESYLTPFRQGRLKLLAAPVRPEQAELITAANFQALLKTMRSMFDYIIIDTAPAFNDVILSILDISDEVLVVCSMDVPTIKNVKLCLEIMESLHYDQNKVKLILNRANSEGDMQIKEVEEILQYEFLEVLPSDGKVVVPSVNRGMPFVLGAPEAPISQHIFSLASMIANGQVVIKEERKGVLDKVKRLWADL
ncbi:MAG: response regulator [Pelosinus sp.]|nr:response regulator [Pelosinus sp.]